MKRAPRPPEAPMASPARRAPPVSPARMLPKSIAVPSAPATMPVAVMDCSTSVKMDFSEAPAIFERSTRAAQMI